MLKDQAAKNVLGSSLILAGILGFCLAMPGCSHTRIVKPPNELRVFNYSRQSVAGIRRKVCHASDSQYEWIPKSAIEPGASFGIPLASGCFDFSAVSTGGKEIGRQFDVQMIPGAVWQLR
jgi:hypothetical protein